MTMKTKNRLLQFSFADNYLPKGYFSKYDPIFVSFYFEKYIFRQVVNQMNDTKQKADVLTSEEDVLACGGLRK